MPLEAIEDLLQSMGVRLSSAAVLSAADSSALQRYREHFSDDDERDEEADQG